MKRSVLVLALSGAVLAAGCGNKSAPSGPTASGPAPKLVGVSLLARTDPFYHDLEDAMKAEARVKNMTLDVQDARRLLEPQLSQVETFVAQKKDAIVICPADSDGIGNAVKKANAASIPVFTADIKANSGAVISHIASDNEQGGRLAGEYMAKALNGKGKVVILDFPQVTSVSLRTKGFLEGMSKAPGIVVVERPSARGEMNLGLSQMENMLQKYPDLDGVFAINDQAAMGALKAIQDRGNKHIVLIGYDGDSDAVKDITAGTNWKADAVQYPKDIGKQTIDAIDDYFHGKKPAANIPIKVGVIDQDSLKKAAGA